MSCAIFACRARLELGAAGELAAGLVDEDLIATGGFHVEGRCSVRDTVARRKVNM